MKLYSKKIRVKRLLTRSIISDETKVFVLQKVENKRDQTDSAMRTEVHHVFYFKFAQTK